MNNLQAVGAFTIQVRDKDKYREFKLKELFSIDENDLTAEFSKQASLYAYFAVLSAKAEFDAGLVGMSKAQEQAKADEAFRAELDREGRKYTEAVIKAMVTTDEECTKLAESELGFELDHNLLKAVCKAMEMRADMLISLGSHLRHELSMGGMNIREKGYEKSIEDVREAASKFSKKAG